MRIQKNKIQEFAQCNEEQRLRGVVHLIISSVHIQADFVNMFRNFRVVLLSTIRHFFCTSIKLCAISDHECEPFRQISWETASISYSFAIKHLFQKLEDIEYLSS